MIKIKYISIAVIALVCLFHGRIVLGDNKFEDKVRKMAEQRGHGQKVVIDEASRAELYDFVNNNERVSARDFKKLRLSGTASDVILQDIEKKYGATPDNYQAKIANIKDKKTYEIAFKVRKKMYYKAFYACKNDNEEKVIESRGKVDVIRTRISEIYMNDRSAQYSDEMIKLDEKILEECKYEFANYSLLTSYRVRGMREKYNNLMLRMIKEDQVDFDYLYVGLDKFNTNFIGQYWDFLQHVNRRGDKLILSKDDLVTIAESLLTKHAVVFDLKNSYYYSQNTGLHDAYLIRDAVQCLVNVSTWLREYKLDDLNERFIGKYFTDKDVLDVLNGYDQFNDFREYLKKRQERKL